MNHRQINAVVKASNKNNPNTDTFGKLVTVRKNIPEKCFDPKFELQNLTSAYLSQLTPLPLILHNCVLKIEN